MSGTSLDGIDFAHVIFSIEQNKWDYTILEAETLPYSEDWINILKTATRYSDTALEELNENYTDYLGQEITTFIKKYTITQLDAISSHGHTILHQPEKGITLQIGNLKKIASITKQKVVCDFRVQDILLKGQGAPLVPIGDRLLFSDFDFCLNLGGFSNISFEENHERIAFDICPVNTILNHYAEAMGFPYDAGGAIARTGRIHLEALNALNEIPFYKANHPKSLGFESVRDLFLPLIEGYSIPIEDKLRTFTEHIAIQIGQTLKEKSGRILITGGGAYNNFLIETIKKHLPKQDVIIPDSKTLEFKEALIFGLLGVLKLRNEINVLKSVTGASKDHCSGVIFTPN
ncbi:anhydro-N-acetylmuramic acid kinase [Flavobacterium aciduliphilum]|uniref:Anhydro-N-acetylmuramic acid kinase n=2 Tax=Flavobacterium aciduliphilum TaxID=1101402 RepID=A0A328YM83_9FLAO|nr:anhydro-N-acetylmuramic acid kinase [Flavobacterium aciduliphilum]